MNTRISPLSPVKRFIVRHSSMEPVLRDGDKVLTLSRGMTARLRWVIPGSGGPIRRGDIVCFHKDPSSTLMRIDRVAGLPGEKLEIQKGKLFIDGAPVTGHQAYAAESMDHGPITISDGHYFILGDNLDAAVDSRSFGAIPLDRIFYKALLVYRPFKRAQILI